MAGLCPALALLLASPYLPAATAEPVRPDGGDADVIAARLDASQRLTVPVRIGENGSFRFVVDTGAQRTVVGSALAARLALAPAGNASLIGVAGRTIVDTVTIDAMTLGNRTFTGIVAPVLSEANIGADGIVGIDSLQNQRLLLDFTRNRFIIGDAAADPAEAQSFDIVVRARRRSGQLVITSARIDGVHVDVVVDTGADTSIGNRALQAKLARSAHARTTLVDVTGSQIAAELAVAREISMGSLRIRNVSIAYADALPFTHLGLERRPAILLGMHVLRAFKRIAIDFAKRRVLFDYDAESLLPPG
jgi:predicted aspartyl protease